MVLALLAPGLIVAGCGASKIVVKNRVQTQTVTTVRTVQHIQTVTTAPEPTVYVAASEGLLYKPDSMSYHGGHQAVDRIRWMTYGGAVATGKAMFGRDDCNPSCANGHYTYTPITVKLLQRRTCHGVVAYTFWSLKGAGLNAVSDSVSADYPNNC